MQKNGLSQIVPTAILYMLLASILLFAVDFHNVWSFFSTHLLGGDVPSSTDYLSVTVPLFNFLDKLGTLILMGLWGLVGLGSYYLTFLIWRSSSGVFREFKEASYIGPKQYKNNYWHRVIINNLITISLLIGWILSLYAFFQLLLPQACRLLNHSLNNGIFWHRVGSLASAIIITSAGIYILVRISRLLRANWHQFTY